MENELNKPLPLRVQGKYGSKTPLNSCLFGNPQFCPIFSDQQFYLKKFWNKEEKMAK